MHTVVLHKSEVTDLIREGSLFFMYPGSSIMRFEISALVLNLAAQTRTSSVAKKLETAAPSKGHENVD
jgi:hypothetical protein